MSPVRFAKIKLLSCVSKGGVCVRMCVGNGVGLGGEGLNTFYVLFSFGMQTVLQELSSLSVSSLPRGTFRGVSTPTSCGTERASRGSNWPQSPWGVSPRRTQLPRLKLTKARGLRGPSQFLHCLFFFLNTSFKKKSIYLIYSCWLHRVLVVAGRLLSCGS